MNGCSISLISEHITINDLRNYAFNIDESVKLKVNARRDPANSRMIFIRSCNEGRGGQSMNHGPSVKLQPEGVKDTDYWTPLRIATTTMNNDSDVQNAIKALKSGKSFDGIDYSEFRGDKLYVDMALRFIYDNQMLICAAWYMPRVETLSSNANKIVTQLCKDVEQLIKSGKKNYFKATIKGPKTMDELIEDAKAITAKVRAMDPKYENVSLDFGGNIKV